ncbi:MAG: ferrous iron transport protein B [Oscillatoriophycideae cyanobacterium NC_groundwater_1537_Pr4_S-0.65um_50_18]|nr:ferrous iron transport protein B [Oscillatoriophycideae cyanobacterium NC_groundwater_1537_Pr4_S-0.65um_50_18]
MKQVAVLGMPNTGKSTFFNRLTGASASISNWTGTTVDLMMAQVQLGEEQAEVIDLPGIYDLRGFSEDEEVVRQVLKSTPLHLVLLILNTSQIDRQLSLAIQVKHLRLPTVLLLNMADEAPKFGVVVEVEKLGAELGMPVVLMSAKHGQGYTIACQVIAEMLHRQQESVIATLLEDQLVPDRQIAEEMGNLLQRTVSAPKQLKENRTSRLDQVLLHPLWGLPIFFAAMFCMFQLVYTLATPIQDILQQGLDGFKQMALIPLIAGLPTFLQAFLLEGLYDGLGTVAAFIPVIVLFFLGMAVVEDSGYLARSAFLMDALMARLGLDGRSFVMTLMGFGCNVPAIMGTRVMRSPGLRLLTMLVIPFSLCSARLTVFIFMTAALFSPSVAPAVLFSLYLVSFAAAILTAFLFRGKYPNQEPLVLELPPYRLPTLRQMLLRSWHEVRHFLRFSYRFIIIGVVLIWLLNHLPTDVPVASAESLSGLLGEVTQPFLAPLGITPQLAVTLLFGFIAKEVVLGGLAVIYQQSGDTALMGAIAHQINWAQAYSFMLFTLLYTPCLSAIAVLKSESKSHQFTLLSVAWSLGLAWLSSFVFYQTVQLLGLV